MAGGRWCRWRPRKRQVNVEQSGVIRIRMDGIIGDKRSILGACHLQPDRGDEHFPRSRKCESIVGKVGKGERRHDLPVVGTVPQRGKQIAGHHIGLDNALRVPRGFHAHRQNGDKFFLGSVKEAWRMFNATHGFQRWRRPSTCLKRSIPAKSFGMASAPPPKNNVVSWPKTKTRTSGKDNRSPRRTKENVLIIRN